MRSAAACAPVRAILACAWLGSCAGAGTISARPGAGGDEGTERDAGPPPVSSSDAEIVDHDAASGGGGGGGSNAGAATGQPDGGAAGDAVAGGGATGHLPAVIVDSDMGPDVDDAGALAILHVLADRGEVQLLAVMISTTGPTGTPAIGFVDAVDTYYGRPDLPIGLWKGDPFLLFTKYTADIAANPTQFPHDLGSSRDDVPEAAALYRRILAGMPDASVTIVGLGPMNNLKRLLETTADASSPLNGRDLVARKVVRLVQMGGEYPSGREFNFYQQPAGGTTQAAVDGWPTPIVFSGFEIGVTILTGASLARTPENNPVRRAYELFLGGVGAMRYSWDLTAAYVAVRGAATFWDLETMGRNVISADGSNTWQATSDAQQAYLKAREQPSSIVQVFDDLMAQPPTAKR